MREPPDSRLTPVIPAVWRLRWGGWRFEVGQGKLSPRPRLQNDQGNMDGGAAQGVEQCRVLSSNPSLTPKKTKPKRPRSSPVPGKAEGREGEHEGKPRLRESPKAVSWFVAKMEGGGVASSGALGPVLSLILPVLRLASLLSRSCFLHRPLGGPRAAGTAGETEAGGDRASRRRGGDTWGRGHCSVHVDTRGSASGAVTH
jgi:hypothetical protein